MKKYQILWAILIIFGICLLLKCVSPSKPQASDNGVKAAYERRDFPDFGAMIPVDQFLANYPGHKIFKLSQDYPKELPGDDKIPAFFKIPFDDKSKWMDWLLAARDYCFEGMIDANFIAQDNKKRDWYHMPWLHYGPLASEGFSGLAKEAPISPFQLAPEQKHPGQVYALGFYNDFAGHILYKMWNETTDPDPFVTQGPKGGFPEGTVIFKFLYTELDSTDVHYLKNPYTRLAYITPTFRDSTNRVVKTVNLIQMDIMVRDKRAEKYGTGWIFGNLCYNGNLNKGKTMKDRVMNLVPVGIQFGNDPGYKTNWINPYPVVKTMINDTLKETFINPSADLPPQHLGWGGRLDGPVDLNTASCMSCHQTGEFPQFAALVPNEAFIGDTLPNGSMKYLTQTHAPAWIKYYQNFKCGTAYDPKTALSTDFSLQVSLALTYYWQWKSVTMGGHYSQLYAGLEHLALRGGMPFKMMKTLKKSGKKLKAGALPKDHSSF
jgi:hypothetical protein